MAHTGEQSHFSSRSLDLGERIQRTFGNTAPVRWAMRSNVPSYMALQWFKLPDIDPESISWAREVPGDPDAKGFPRNWGNAAILGVDKSELGRLEAHDPERGRWARDFVAYDADGVVRIGVNPVGDRIFGGAGKEDQAGMLTVAMRLGSGPLRATMGLCQPDIDELFVPDSVVVLEERIPNEEIGPPDYPHTRLAG